MKKIILIMTFILSVSCSTMPAKDFDRLIQEGQCEEALKNVPSSNFSSVIKTTKSISGTVASYVLTGLTYGGEVTFYVVGGVAVGVAVCSPIIALEVGASKNAGGAASTECLKFVTQGLANKSKGSSSEAMYGEKVFNKTNNWRCPDLSDFSQNLRVVATCYENKNDVESLNKAKEQLNIIRNEDFQESCVGDEERNQITKQFEEINEKLKTKG